MRATCVAVALLSSSSLSAQVSVDTAAMRSAAQEFLAGCDAGVALWGRSLCGPMLFIDPDSRFAVGTQRPPEGTFQQQGQLYEGVAPAGMQLANTAREWSGVRWSFVLAPVPQDAAVRRTLMFHESFHRLQPLLGLASPDRINPHLDERDGRYWLRLQLRALAVATRQHGSTGRAAAEDAVLFRAVRLAQYPGADTLEAALELAEGLAEYTGARLAVPGAAGDSVMADAVPSFEQRPSYTRALGYGTGPMLGILLDRYRRGWRARLKSEGFAAQLPRALAWTQPRDARRVADRRALLYGGAEIAGEEDGRVAARLAVRADYRQRLVTGPVLLLASKALNLSFNPNTVVPLDSLGTVYPTGSFTAEWGTLTVERGGVLVSPMYNAVRVPAGGTLLPVNGVVSGAGWTLTLTPEWKLIPGERQGDYTVSPP